MGVGGGGMVMEGRPGRGNQFLGRQFEFALQRRGQPGLAESAALGVGGVADAIGRDQQGLARLQLAVTRLETGLGAFAQPGARSG